MSSFRHEDWIVTSTRYCWTVNREIEIASGKMAGQKMLDTHGHYLNLDTAARSLPEHILKNADLHGVLAMREMLQDALAKVCADWDRRRIKGRAA